MINTWFTSDPHLKHRAMAWNRKHGAWPTSEQRELITPEMVAEHDAMLAENWDRVIHKDDTVWVLGDLIANSSSFAYSIDWFKQRKGRKHLLLGNHDPGHPLHRDGYTWLRKYYEVFESVQTTAERKVGNVRVMLSHFPYTGDGDGREDRASQHRLRNEGLPILHGHVHSKEQLTFAPPPGIPDALNPELYVDRVPQIHVGVDAHDYTPVSLETIIDLLEQSKS